MQSKNKYENPFIPQRADPFVTKGDGCFYFTASYPAFETAENGYDRINLRKAKTVSGLSKSEEATVWSAHTDGVMAKHIWAPELHKICGKWYIFFAAGNSDDKWKIRPYVLMCKGNDPMTDKWEEKGMMRAADDDKLSFTDFSLDMTYFENENKHYAVWAQKCPDSSLLIAQIDGKKPWKLISEPTIISKPQYSWEKVRYSVNEGASVLKYKDKIIMFFSASGTGEEYCIGMLTCDKDNDLLKAESWKKHDKPILKTKDLENEVGPGHNSFVTDEDGRLLMIYHSRPKEHLERNCGTYCNEPLYDPCRHARIKELSFDENYMPVFS